MSNNKTDHFFDSKVLGHPSGLFVLFFTEMWERFSYYGMRALLVLFFTASILDEGWGWPKEHALAIFGTYTSLVYLSTLLGGYFADNIIGFRWAVVVGALLMALGHGAMAIETPGFIYLGLTLLVFGSGFFKPNMTSIISEMYKDRPEKKDGAYTIFYMGVNAGAFFGIMLCGYLGEKVGWTYGFGVAGIFMLFGLLQFWFAQDIFGDIGLKPKKEDKAALIAEENPAEEKRNPFTGLQKALIGIATVLGLAWVLNDPISKISEGAVNFFNFKVGPLDGSNVIILIALLLFILLLALRMPKYSKIVRERMLAVMFFAFITIFFWAVFEQSPGSLTLFARDYTQRILEGSAGTAFQVINMLITIVPLAIISWVLIMLSKQTFKKYALSNIILSVSFIIVWGIAGWMIYNEFKSTSYTIEYTNINGDTETYKLVTSAQYAEGESFKVNDIEALTLVDVKDKSFKGKTIKDNVLYDKDGDKLGEIFEVKVSDIVLQPKKGAFGSEMKMARVEFSNKAGEVVTRDIRIDPDSKKKPVVGDKTHLSVTHEIKYDSEQKSASTARVASINAAVEIGASWFSILNSLFIIVLAPLFSKWWESKYNPSANMKYAIGMFLLGLGMAAVAFGANGIAPGAKAASVSLFWLVFVYLFHTMGELCVSPVALSYVSKLVPGRMIAVMFGVWYLAVAIGMKLAGVFGEASESLAETKGLSYFFWLLTFVSWGLALLSVVLSPVIRKLMHGVR